MGFGNGGGGGESFGAETEVPDSFQKSILAADAVPSPPFSPHLWLILFRFGFFTLPVIAVRRRRRLLHGDGTETLLCIAQMKANERLTDAFIPSVKKYSARSRFRIFGWPHNMPIGALQLSELQWGNIAETVWSPSPLSWFCVASTRWLPFFPSKLKRTHRNRRSPPPIPFLRFRFVALSSNMISAPLRSLQRRNFFRKFSFSLPRSGDFLDWGGFSLALKKLQRRGERVSTVLILRCRKKFDTFCFSSRKDKNVW